MKPKTAGEQMAALGRTVGQKWGLTVGRVWDCARLSGQQHASQPEWRAVGRSGRTVGREWGCARPSGQQHARRLRSVYCQ